MARANDGTRTVSPIELFAAAAFQLGGLPAMANGLLAQIDMEDDGTRLYGSFVSADFDDVLAAATSFWQRNADLTDREAPRRLLEDDGQGRIAWYFTVELVRSLGLIAYA
ncbi:MAG: hypothetical protein E5W30_17045, partial [Mesorhizobium sp.]